MESKGIAIPYIIALVIGIIVLVFVVYWVYRLFSAPQISYEDCRSRAVQWCQSCRAVNPTLSFNGGNTGVTNLNFIGPDCAKVLYDRFKSTNHFNGDPYAGASGIQCDQDVSGDGTTDQEAVDFCNRVGG